MFGTEGQILVQKFEVRDDLIANILGLFLVAVKGRIVKIVWEG
jgi:hypothetical protein